MMMMSFVAMGLSASCGSSGAIDGFRRRRQLRRVLRKPLHPVRPEPSATAGGPASVGFAATFAIITVALISGAVADRAKFGAWALFTPIWVTLVYAPLAFMGLGRRPLSPMAPSAARRPAIDFAGGTVVHINAGVAGLILALILGIRKGFGKDPNHRPHNIPFVMLGAALLGSAGSASTPVPPAPPSRPA